MCYILNFIIHRRIGSKVSREDQSGKREQVWLMHLRTDMY